MTDAQGLTIALNEVDRLRAERDALKGEVERLTHNLGVADRAVIDTCRREGAAEAALESLRGEVREVVGKGEWDYVGHDDPGMCPSCANIRDEGHAPDCRLAALLKRVGGEG